MDKSYRKIIILLVFAVLGTIVSIQFRSNLLYDNQKAKSSLSAEKLIESVNNELAVEANLKNEIEANLKIRDDFLKSYLESRNENELLNEWESVRLKAGLTDVEGPGIIITLNDALARKDKDPMLLIIHDSDIKIIVNDLKKSNAQAISINGERLGPVSEQVCAGPTIRINKNRYAVPYVIHAIGNPDDLYERMIQSERIGLMIRDNIRIDIQKSKNVFVPRIKSPERFVTGMEVVNSEV